MFDELKGWELLSGSHPFPKGGGCFNEIAAVVSGASYRPVSKHADMPAGFCPAVTMYTMFLNDRWDHETRQRLIPYITRVIGISDSKSVADARKMAIVTVAYNCLGVQPVRIASDGLLHDFSAAAMTAEYNVAPALKALLHHPDIALEALDAMLAIGKQGDPLDNYLMGERIEAVQRVPVTELVPGVDYLVYDINKDCYAAASGHPSYFDTKGTFGSGSICEQYAQEKMKALANNYAAYMPLPSPSGLKYLGVDIYYDAPKTTKSLFPVAGW